MDNLVASILLFVAFLFGLLSLIDLRRHPWKLLPVLVILHLMFFMYPFYDFILGEKVLEYHYFSYFGLFPDKGMAIVYLSIVTISLVIMSSVSFLNINLGTLRFNNGDINPYNFKKFTFIILVVITGIIVLYANRNFTGSLYLFFSPARKELFLSGYERKFLFILPCLVITLYKFSNLYNKKFFLLYVLFGILIVSILGQRRDLINFCIFSFLIYNYDFLKDLKFSKKIQLYSGVFFITLIPLLWYARVIFTQIIRHGEITINPFTLRGPVELIFGSSTTGFMSFFLQQKYMDLGVIDKFHSIYQMLFVPIPRLFLDSKPSTIPQLIKMAEQDTGNISNFFINEFYMNFGLFFFIGVLVFSIILNWLYFSMKDSNGDFNVIYLFLFCNLILLFKNGWSDYIITVILYVLLFYFFVLINKVSFKI